MLLDMASSRGVITTAGLTTPAEGFLLGKPVCVVPLPDQWEQLANAIHLQEAGMASACHGWNYDQLLETPPPAADHPGHLWLTTDAETVLDVIVGREAATCAAA
jgi:UDP-N-acetylglucosamine:LPS N-acetylglucosamine transferase